MICHKPCHYLNVHSFIVNWTFTDKHQWNFFCSELSISSFGKNQPTEWHFGVSRIKKERILGTHVELKLVNISEYTMQTTASSRRQTNLYPLPVILLTSSVRERVSGHTWRWDSIMVATIVCFISCSGEYCIDTNADSLYITSIVENTPTYFRFMEIL